MADDDDNNAQYDAAQQQQQQQQDDDDDGFGNYEETSVDPGIWLLLFTTLFCFGVMLFVVPLLVAWKKQQHQRKEHAVVRGGKGKRSGKKGRSGSSVLAEALYMTGLRVQQQQQQQQQQMAKTSSTSSNSDDDADAAAAADGGRGGRGGDSSTGSRHDETSSTKSKKNAAEYQQQQHVDVNLVNTMRVDLETRKIMALAGPFTLQALCSSICSNACLIIVSREIGTKAAVAYAIVQVLVGLSDGVLQGPISACTTLCSHAVGAGNSKLAGEYIQLAVVTYVLCSLPVLFFWWYYMYEVVLYLEWGDAVTAQLSQDFVRLYIFSYWFDAISSSVWQLLEITGHAFLGTVCSMIWGISNVVILGLVVLIKNRHSSTGSSSSSSSNNNNGEGDDYAVTQEDTSSSTTLRDVAWVYVGTAAFFVAFTYLLADCRGWLQPFKPGLYKTFPLANPRAIKLILTQAVPLSAGYLLSNAEWVVLTFMASHLGPAEVAAWALLGSIWDIFYKFTAGIGDAAEIRVSHHLGVNSPTMAQLSAYKSLFLGMVVASVVSIVYFSLQNQLPGWFTKDETLQAMLRELVPFVGVANLTMTFGMQCWSLIGSQGKYSLATWVNFASSWGICMPLAAIFTYGFRIDLQGLAAASAIGYVSTGAVLSYVLLGTDWQKVAYKIQKANSESASGQGDDNENLPDGLFALTRRGKKTLHATSRMQLLTIPAGRRSGMTVGTIDGQKGHFILRVRRWSPLRGSAKVGAAILAINGENATHMTGEDLKKRFKDTSIDRVVAVVETWDSDADDDDKQAGNETCTARFWDDGYFGMIGRRNRSVANDIVDGDDGDAYQNADHLESKDSEDSSQKPLSFFLDKMAAYKQRREARAKNTASDSSVELYTSS